MKKSSLKKASRKSTVTRKQVHLEIYLPPDLKKWAEKYAYNLSSTLSDLLRDLLEYEQFRDGKMSYTTRPDVVHEMEREEKGAR